MSNLTDEQKDALAIIHDGLYNDPETRATYEDIVAKKFPKAAAAMPERQMRQTLDAKLAEIDRKSAELDKKIEKVGAVSDTEKRRERLLKGFKAPDGTWVQVSREDLVKIEEQMLQSGNADHDTAAWRFVRERDVAVPRSSAPNRSMLVPGLKGAGGDEFKWLEAGIKGDLSDLDRVTRAEAYRVWDEVTSNGGALGR